MIEKENILSQIENLKRDRPKGWKWKLRPLFNALDKINDPFGQHEWIGTEKLGRHAHKDDCPTYEKLDDESNP